MDMVYFISCIREDFGSIDQTGKYIIILNKISSFIVIVVSLIIVKNILHLIFG